MVGRRVEKTKKAVIDAFLALAREHEYEDLNVKAIVARANVGRSTFYKHFTDKDDVLVQAMAGPLELFSELDSSQKEMMDCLESMLSHFWENRAKARKLFTGLPGRKLVAKLAIHIEARFAKIIEPERSIVSLRCQSEIAAQAQFSIFVAWITGREVQSSRSIAFALALLVERFEDIFVFEGGVGGSGYA